MNVILDTSVLIDNPTIATGSTAAISTISLAELYFGVFTAHHPKERARRATQLVFIESGFDALPLDKRIGQMLGQLQATLSARGVNPRRHTADLAIAATAIVHEAALLTNNFKDFKVIADLVEVREPPT